MFDDPNKTLRRMEEELWAAEYPEEDPDGPADETDVPLEELYDFGDSDWLQDTKALIGDDEDIPIRNHANNYGRPVAGKPSGNSRQNSGKTRPSNPRNDAVDFQRTVYADETLDEHAAVFVEKTKKKGAGCLPILVLLEVLGIAGVIWWWIRWLQ